MIKKLRFCDVRVGQMKSRRYLLTKDVYSNFLAAFHDTSPIHMDDVFAKKKGFKSRVMHGAILNGFISHFIGVCFPGRHALLQSVSIQYRAPVYLGDALSLRCRVEHKSNAAKTLSLLMTWRRSGSAGPVATAKAQVGMTA
jgi:3-hydroxybutyryl-CoA dehydratase